MFANQIAVKAPVLLLVEEQGAKTVGSSKVDVKLGNGGNSSYDVICWSGGGGGL